MSLAKAWNMPVVLKHEREANVANDLRRIHRTAAWEQCALAPCPTAVVLEVCTASSKNKARAACVFRQSVVD